MKESYKRRQFKLCSKPISNKTRIETRREMMQKIEINCSKPISNKTRIKTIELVVSEEPLTEDETK